MSFRKHKWHLNYIQLAKDNNFSFEKTKYPLEKNKISLLDLDKIIEEKDVEIIEHFIPSIAQYNIDSHEHLGILDQNFFKLFRMTQLAVEYLLFCKEYLDKNIIELKEQIKELTMENDELRIFNDELKQHTDTLLEKLKNNETNRIYKCNCCSKAFSTEGYLLAHIERRHNKNNDGITGLDVEMEIKQIKEKLNHTEKLIKNEELNPKIEDSLNKNYTKVSELLLKFESLRNQVENDFKMLYTQKDFEEKYLKIFQSALENMKIQINKELGIQNSPYKFHEKRNSITQTESDPLNISEKNVQVEVSNESQHPLKDLFEEGSLQKLEDRMTVICENISKNMGSSLKNIEAQMGALWQKLQGLESETTKDLKSQEDNWIGVTTENTTLQPQPKSRKRYRRKLDNADKASEPRFTSNQEIIRAEISNRPSSETRYDTLEDPENKTTNIVDDYEGITVVKSSKSCLDNEHDDLDRIDVLDEGEPGKSITVVKSVNSLYDTEEIESDNEGNISSSEDTSETDNSAGIDIAKAPSSNIVSLHKEKSVSTLGKRSLSSLRRVSVSSEVVARLRKEMEKVLSQRLATLGVSNEWNGIPERTHLKVMDILNHQAKLIQKSVPNYKKIREGILMDVEEELGRKKALKSIDHKKSRIKLRGISSLTNPKVPDVSLRIRRYQSAPAVEIKNRKMYESDSSSEEENKIENLKKPNSTFIQKTPHYSAVIQELKQNQEHNEEHMEAEIAPLPGDNLDRMDLHMKGVLKNFQSFKPVPKKRVLFDLKSQEPEIQKPISKDAGGGSTTSVASSVLDLSEDSSAKIEDKEKNEIDIKDFSDSDFSIFEKKQT